jgi:hypothetical protein
MLRLLQIVTTVLVAVAPALAHALEFPGKMRLSQNAYATVQPFYYPGFTFAGIAEVAGMIATTPLFFVTTPGTVGSCLDETAGPLGTFAHRQSGVGIREFSRASHSDRNSRLARTAI